MTRYRQTTNALGQTIKRVESVFGSLAFDTIETNGVSGTSLQRIGCRNLFPYQPEVKAQTNPYQFGRNKYFSPSFTFCLDWYGYFTPAQRREVGINFFTTWNVRTEDNPQVLPGEQMFYYTQNNLGFWADPQNFFIADLQTFCSSVWYQLPEFGKGQFPNVRKVVFDFETTIFGINPGNIGGPAVHPDWPDGGYFSNWDAIKNNTFVLEGSPGSSSLAALAQTGRDSWNYEMHVRRANRMNLIQELTRYKSAPGTLISIGVAPYVSFPDYTVFGSNGAFIDGRGNTQYIGGDTNGNITLNIPPATPVTVNIGGTIDNHQDFWQGYYYELNFELSSTDHDEIYTQKKAGTQTYHYLWSKMKVIHSVGKEKGWIQLNRRLIQNRTGKTLPMQRQVEPPYEFGPQIPFNDLQNILDFPPSNDRNTPRTFVAPYIQYNAYAVTRFMAGNDPYWGFYMFPIDILSMNRDPATPEPREGRNVYGHELHSISAMLQARADLQPYERYYTGSTLIEDPEVQLNQTGSWSAYNGAEATGYHGGATDPTRPAFMLRYKAIAGGWHVLIMGGHDLNWTAERTDLVRAPGGLLNGNMFRIKLRGPSAQTYEFKVSSVDTNQIYEAVPVAVPNWEKAGYSGRVGPLPTI